MVWILKIITHRLLSVLKKRGGLFKKKKGLAFPLTDWKRGLHICEERKNREGVGKRRNRLGDSEEESQSERAEDPATSPRGVKLFKKKEKVLVFH